MVQRARKKLGTSLVETTLSYEYTQGASTVKGNISESGFRKKKRVM